MTLGHNISKELCEPIAWIIQEYGSFNFQWLTDKSRHHSVKFWQLVSPGNSIWCCWHYVVKASLPLYSEPNVWFSSHRQSTTKKWTQHVGQNSQSVHATAFQSFSWGNISCPDASILYIYAANYSSNYSWLHLWCQACPMCQTSRDMSVVFPVAGWGVLTRNGEDVNCHKIGLLLCSWLLPTVTNLQETEFMHFSVLLA